MRLSAEVDLTALLRFPSLPVLKAILGSTTIQSAQEGCRRTRPRSVRLTCHPPR
jgi:hypothetical protein